MHVFPVSLECSKFLQQFRIMQARLVKDANSLCAGGCLTYIIRWRTLPAQSVCFYHYK